MKRLLIYLFAVALAGCFWSCDEDKPGDDSIFDTTPVEGARLTSGCCTTTRILITWSLSIKWKILRRI